MKKIIWVKGNERLREVRFKQKMPQTVLALKTALDTATISRIECGYRQPTKHQAEAIAKALGVKAEWLFGETHAD